MTVATTSPAAAQSWGADEDARPVDPATLEPLGHVVASSPAELDATVAAAHAGLADWARDHRMRATILLAWAERLLAHADDLVTALVAQTGKPVREARMEVAGAAEALRYNAGLCRYIGGRAGSLADGNVLHLVRQPVGPTAFIVPWNWPVLLLLRDLSPALAAGVTAVVKPSPQTALVTERAIELGHAAGLPREAVAIVNGDRGVGAALVAHPLIRAVSFTGSTTVGRHIMTAAAADFTRPLLELGGKGVALIFEDADLPRACADVVAAAFITAGQMCMACTRVLVHRSVYPQVLQTICGATEMLTVGDPRLETTQIGPLISPAAARRVIGYLDRARHEATVVTGGREVNPDGLRGGFITPAVITDVDVRSPLVQDDVFGPVVTIEPFDDEEAALASANSTPFGLVGSVWTADVRRAWRASSAIAAGTVWVNGYNRSYPEMPSGGFKASGLGRTRGIEGLEQFTEIKSIHFTV